MLGRPYLRYTKARSNELAAGEMYVEGWWVTAPHESRRAGCLLGIFKSWRCFED